MRATSWDELPLLLKVEDLRERLGLSREQSYRLAHVHGRRVGGRMLVPKAAIRRVFEGKESSDN